MNNRLITIGLISGTAIVTGLGFALPELYTGIASMVMGGASLSYGTSSLQGIGTKKDKQNDIRRAEVNQLLPSSISIFFY